VNIFNLKETDCKKQLKLLSICFFSAFIIWAVLFILRMSIDDSQHETNISKIDNSTNVLTDVFKAHSTENHNKVFYLIISNNIKVVIINILGGVFLGLGTFVNLAQNGFFAADVFCTVHKRGMSWSKIIEYTAPHSFEMIGIWLSGGIGFYIALLFINMMVKNKYPNSINFKIIIGSIVSIALIITSSAYIEAYVSIK